MLLTALTEAQAGKAEGVQPKCVFVASGASALSAATCKTGYVEVQGMDFPVQTLIDTSVLRLSLTGWLTISKRRGDGALPITMLLPSN